MYNKINLAGGRFKSVDYGKIPHIVFECLDGKLITCCDTDYIIVDVDEDGFVTEDSLYLFIVEIDGEILTPE